ncbi:putative type VI secretion system effector [Chitiniphilus shinanonensis]|uniref:putative type VI secretion system effector n=1 Tax=Chitiniphilus shinanonensis TaxID=553088 RepID=UPI003070F104
MSVQLLRGTITNLRTTRQSASFLFTDDDKTSMGVIAIAAAMAGLGPQAVAAAAATTSMEEEADYLEFELDGKAVRGWVWRSPFSEGDYVEAVVERTSGYNAYAIARPVDRVIALYPHCSRGSRAHWKNAIKWWLIGVTGLVLLGGMIDSLASVFSGDDLQIKEFALYILPWLALSFYSFFGLMTYSMVKKWMPFVQLAEKCFTTLGWENPSQIDLVKRTKQQRKKTDPGTLGVMYFRY